MDDALGVRGGEGIGERQGEAQDLVRRQPAGDDPRGQGLALDQLHGEEVDAPRLLDGIEGDDVGMVERGDGPRLAAEALQAHRVSG